MGNFDFKVYTNNYRTLSFLAETFNLKLEYLKGNTFRGYVSNGNYLRVFSEGSYVDLSEDIKELVDYRRERL